MADTQTTTSLRPEARYRLTDEAIKHAKDLFDTKDLTVVASRLGLTRTGLWRLRYGKIDPLFSRAARVADTLGLPIDQAFKRCQ